jgi:filamentous hemagglutinin family protein
MTVTNSQQAILNWGSFSIGQGAAVYFQQPNASSQVLNRVTGGDPSAILGSLGSNGKVWLLNPNGVLFGTTARVDVAGMVASTLRISDLDWTAGRYRLSAGHQDLVTASVSNQGEIRTAQGGTLALIAGTVGNEGLMRAPGGQVVLAAGQTVELVDTGTANLSVRVTAPSGQARNLGMIEAAGGRIGIEASNSADPSAARVYLGSNSLTSGRNRRKHGSHRATNLIRPRQRRWYSHCHYRKPLRRRGLLVRSRSGRVARRRNAITHIGV